MISWTAKKFIRGNAQKFTSLEREIGIPSFFMQGPLKEGNKIQSWESRIKMEIGVGIKIVSPRLQFPILRKYTPPPSQVK